MQYQKLKKCIDSGRLQLRRGEAIQHYLIVIALAGFSILGIYIMFSAKDEDQFERSVIFFIISCLIGLLFLFIQYRRLRFVMIETELSQDEIAEVINKVAMRLNWKQTSKGKNYYTASTPTSFLQGSWGEQITILLNDKKVYINSICDLKKQSSVTAFGRNRKNVITFKRELNLIEMVKKTAKNR
ncbi:hypothetical protein OGH69_13565 [Flavobacterium sp. MFBS3-15]|uniref:hypothetical protein n=1 Tax=Flavobacterium sp. MFBS3-15 TaxID=2989816 RepID=UPI0022365CE5|nr:hypothetical protein [Flavobacterium sp. MFBS3-15]MCW4470001.1 hypothetical protein [Flavobacterium sp. MFBS3-15]